VAQWPLGPLHGSRPCLARLSLLHAAHWTLHTAPLSLFAPTPTPTHSPFIHGIPVHPSSIPLNSHTPVSFEPIANLPYSTPLCHCHSATLPPLPPIPLSLIHPSLHSFVPLSFFQSLFTPHSAPSSIIQHATTSIIISIDCHHHIWRRTFRHSNNPIHPSSATLPFLSQARTPPVAILASAITIPPHTSMTREKKQMHTIHQHNQVTL
jgi:hypothetical protein